MKVLFLGMGSIGTRHVKNLRKAAAERGISLAIHAVRSTEMEVDAEIKYYVVQFRRGEQLDDNYDIIFITNPTALHFQAIQEYAPMCNHMFIEKPIFEHPDYPLEDILKHRKGVWYVAAPLRHTEVYRHLKNKVVNLVDVCSARIICSSYMPDWQKGRDYRKSFRSILSQGGGVDIDLVHEIDYMVDLFGFPAQVHRAAGKFSKLEMDACDLASYIFVYSEFVVEMHLDYFGRFPKREIEIFTDDDVIIGDFLERKVMLKQSSSEFCFSHERDHYFEEMKFFLAMVLDKEINTSTPETAFNVLRLAKGMVAT